MTDAEDEQRCYRCRHTKSMEHYSQKTESHYYKCCDSCRKHVHRYQSKNKNKTKDYHKVYQKAYYKANRAEKDAYCQANRKRLAVTKKTRYKAKCEIFRVLNNLRIDFEFGCNTGLKFDFTVRFEDRLLFIEYDALKKTQEQDTIKTEFCEDRGYPLLRIPYIKYGLIPSLVVEFLVEYTNWGYE